MANSDAVRALQQGSQTWRVYAEQHAGDPASCDFTGAEFKDLSLLDCIFYHPAIFDDCTIGNFNLEGVITHAGASFVRARFSGQALIRNHRSVDDGRLSFESATFEGNVVLGHVPNAIDISFKAAKFEGGFRAIEMVPMPPNLDFSTSTFRGSAIFRKVMFGHVKFDFAEFGHDNDEAKQATFNGAIFDQAASFHRCKFRGGAIFENAKFNASTSFKDACFQRAPNFHNAELHEGLIFSDPSDFDRQFPDTKSPEARLNYQTLKRKMAGREALNEALAFSRLELKAKQVTETPSRKWLYVLYGLFANYGLSFARPFGGLLLLTTIGAALLWSMSLNYLPFFDKEIWNLAIHASFPFLGSLKSVAPEDMMHILKPEYWVWYSVLAVFQGLVSAVLLFLVGLGVRNMLRLK